jgi:uncharacterized delta-60 repeat protein
MVLAAQPDSSVVVIGIKSDHNVWAARVLPDGTRDPSYGASGPIQMGAARIYAAGSDGAGNTIVVEADPQSGNARVLRLDTAGLVDPTYATNGTADLPLFLSAGLVATDGSVVLGGTNDSGGQLSDDRQLARLTPQGHLDTTFGEAGFVRSPENSTIKAIDVDDNGRLVAYGAPGERFCDQPRFAPCGDSLVARFLIDGTLDTSFGIAGVTQPVMRAFDLRIDRRGRVLLISIKTMIRLNADGSVDPSVTPNAIRYVYGQYLTPLPDGSTLVSGGVGTQRVLDDGTNDPTFGRCGLGAVNVDARPVLLPNGRLLVPTVIGSQAAITSLQSATGGEPNAYRRSGESVIIATRQGRAVPLGAACQAGGADQFHPVLPVVGIASTPSSYGYWMVASDGGIFSFGDATFYGSTGSLTLNQPIVAMAPTPSGHGYWMVASDGGIFSFGDATFYGSTGNLKLNSPIIGMAPTPSGHGYWMLGADCGIFTFGDATFYGSDVTPQSPSTCSAILASSNTGYGIVHRSGVILNHGTAVFPGYGDSPPLSDNDFSNPGISATYQ